MCQPAPMMNVNFYAGSDLDRVAQQRRDPDWVARTLAAPSTRWWPILGERHWLDPDTGEPGVITGRHLDLERLRSSACGEYLLGVAPDGRAEAVLALDAERLPAFFATDSAAYADLRRCGPRLDRRIGARLAFGRALTIWHRDNGHCAACGRRTEVREGGARRQCSQDGCGRIHFPRVDPAVITLVYSGDYCLLARQAQWPPGMHSVLAGFVEPGESLEEAVAREIWEETTVAVVEVTYQSSQPWPFPGSVMLGFRARALTSRIRLADDELESARWFHRDEILDLPEDHSFRLPRADSIARRLIGDWLRERPD